MISLREIERHDPYLISKKRFTQYNDEDVFVLSTGKRMNKNLLHDILYEDDLYDYYIKYLKRSNDDSFYFLHKKDKAFKYIIIKRKDIYLGLNEMIVEGLIPIDELHVKRLSEINYNMSLRRFEDENKGKEVSVMIDGHECLTTVDSIIKLLNMDVEEFNDFLTNGKSSFGGIKKDEFVYILVNYIKKAKLKDLYILDDVMLSRIQAFQNNELIDIEAFNQLLTTDVVSDDAIVNPDIKTRVLKNIPNTLNDLERVLYVYIMLYETYSYNPKLFVDDNRTEGVKEFSKTFANILNKYKVNYEITSETATNFKIKFRVGKFIMLLNARHEGNDRLTGIRCMNLNKATSEEFKETFVNISKMFGDVDQEEVINDEVKVEPTVEETVDLESLLKEYNSLNPPKVTISLKDRISILLDKIETAKVHGATSLAYVLLLRKNLFTYREREHNFDYKIIYNHSSDETCGILILNATSMKENPENNVYYLFMPPNGLFKKNPESAKLKLETGEYEEIEKYRKVVDGKTPEEDNLYV